MTDYENALFDVDTIKQGQNECIQNVDSAYMIAKQVFSVKAPKRLRREWAPLLPGPYAVPAVLPCLYMNNVIENDKKKTKTTAKRTVENPLLSYDKKAAASLFNNAAELLGRGVERCAFVTITTPQNFSYWSKKGWKTANGRFRSFIGNSGGLASVFGSGCAWCRVIEPQKRGAIHWHMIIDTGIDIRSGVDFEAFNNGDYRSAGPLLRGMWSRMRSAAKRYGLGRVEIMPVKSDHYEAAARYVGKYISKGVQLEVWEREHTKKERPAHSRRVGFSKGWKVSNTNFAWLEHGENWRKAVKGFAEALGFSEYSQLAEHLGPKWAWYNRDFIIENYGSNLTS